MDRRTTRTRSPLTVAIWAVLVLAAVCSVDATFGWQTVMTNQNNPHADIIGFGALFAAIGVLLFTVGPYFAWGFLLRLLGVPVFIAGYGFFGGGVAQLLMPRVNYFTVWGMDMGIIAVAALLVWLLSLMLANMPPSGRPARTPRTSPTGTTQIFFTRECQSMFVPFMIGVSAIILTIGLLA